MNTIENTKPITLENTLPSELIRIAVADLMRVEKLEERYIVDMSEWHRAKFVWNSEILAESRSEKCSVCFAGSVMAGTLGGDDDEEISPSDFAHPVQQRLLFLNELRMAVPQRLFEAIWPEKWDQLCSAFSIGRGALWYTYAPRYAGNPEGFKKVMLEIADKLATVGM